MTEQGVPVSEYVPVYSHAAMLVSDIEASAQFYKDVFAWEPSFASTFTDGSLGDANGFSGSPGRILMGQVGGVQLELVEMEPSLEPRPLPPRSYGLHMVSVYVPDVAVARARCEKAGVDIRREVRIGDVLLLVVADPDGQEVGVIGPARVV
jgi:catechol 2,3-dioxygenase-like lactoylglutathione lyase family enzyme